MNSKVIKISCFVTMLALLSCSSEKSPQVNGVQKSEDQGVPGTSLPAASTGEKAQYSLEIFPARATRSSTLSVFSKDFNVNDAKIEWVINGSPGAGSGVTFKASETKKGDRVQARAVFQGKEILSSTVEIKNAPPEITKVKIMPEVFKPGDTWWVDVAGSDPDGDAVTFLYEWKRNGGPAGKGRMLESQMKRGDKISVRITPYDGTDYGRPVFWERELANMPPWMSEEKKINFDGKVLTCQITASDPDGDPLVYSLKAAPQGMTINPSTGLITWNVPRDFQGTASVTAAVNDGHGGEASHTFSIAVHP
jgi:hypothetical protein